MINQLVITAADAELECAIELAIDTCMLASREGDRAGCIAAIERACELHKMRRPEIVAYLEQRRGLRK